MAPDFFGRSLTQRIASRRVVRSSDRVKTIIPLVALLLSSAVFVQAEDPQPAPAAPAPVQAATTAPAATTTPKNVTPDEAEKLLQEKKDVVILDVRTPEEFSAGHIAGAQNVDFMAEDFREKLKVLDPTKSYLVHCAVGGRSSKAVKLMQQQNFAEIYHMNGGFSAWKEAGKPIAK